MVTSASIPVFDPAGQHEDVDSKIVAALERIGQALRWQLSRAAQMHGLSPLQAQVLVFLRYHPQTRATGLAHEFSLRLPTVSDTLSTLEAKGLIARYRDPRDRRAHVLDLTPRGRHLAEQLAGWADAVRPMLDFVSSHEREQVLVFLLRLIEQFQRAGIVTVVRMCLTCRFFRPNAHLSSKVPHHCALLDKPLSPATLRLDCPEYDAEWNPETFP